MSCHEVFAVQALSVAGPTLVAGIVLGWLLALMLLGSAPNRRKEED